ncbi:MAG: aspartate/glutamate racemase family protein [Proteobacteria bacterium]|nr:aspartate/glutamate racemase family protein [Pseudomonadota bacterium]
MTKANGSAENGRIVVINPNSTEAVTRGIDAAMTPFRFAGGPIFDCVTLKAGPPGIATQRHVDSVVQPICDLIAKEDNTTDAFVIACFSDPGLLSAKETTAKPVFGIGAASYAAATLLGERFGVIAILPASVGRQRRAIRLLGLEQRYAASLPIGIGAENLEGDRVKGRMIDVGRELIDAHGADVLIMGCAGMAKYRKAVEDALAVPVIDPAQAAAAQALATVRIGN